MHLTCPQCGTVYDVSEYPKGHSFQCQCGRTLEVGASPQGVPQAAAPGGAPEPAPAPRPPAGTDTGLEPGIKALLFFLNLCFTPIVGLVWWLIVRQDKPRTAKDVCTWTWIPAVIAIVLWGLYFLFVFGLALSGGFAGGY